MATLPHPPFPRSGGVWSLELLGVARLVRGGVALEPLERKTAALFAILALEGPTPRSKIAGLLWPEVDEGKARRNLRQRLHRLKDVLGVSLIIPEDTLYLDPALEVDAVCLESLAFTGDYLGALRKEGELLGTHDYDDCLELAEWVELARERVRRVRREAMLAEIQRLEAAGDYPAALPWAERLLNDDLVSEEAHRRVMRLLYLMGERAGALKAYHRCREILRRELGVEPLPETAELARTIDQGAALPHPPAAQRPRIPLQVLRPPTLVGREREWSLLEEAYQQGKLVFLRGEPGVGKTRLALDFAASKGRVLLLAARPGDAGIPFSSYARSLRESLAEHPEWVAHMLPWVRAEISRILPELAEGVLPPPLASEAEKMRLFDALGTLTLSTYADGEQVLVSDDAQYLDPASIEVMLYQLNKFGRLGHPGGFPFTIVTYRRGEMDPEVEQNVFFPLLEAGAATLIDVEPLQPDALKALLHSLEDPLLDRLSPALERYSGGNPMFVLELLKSLYETGQIQRGLPQQLGVPGKIGFVVQRRLERLSPAGLRLARTAAVAGVDFSSELAGAVLGVSPLDLVEPWAELEAAQLILGSGFVHDLVHEATLAGIPAPIKALLHRRIAEYLEAHRAEPARIAQHWLEADESNAIPYLLEAARAAQVTYRLSEASRFYEQAARILERLGRSEEAFASWQQACATLLRFDTGPRHEAALERLFALAESPQQRAQAHLAEASLAGEHHDRERAEQSAREGYRLALEAQNPSLQAKLLTALGQALWLQGRTEEVVPLLEQAAEIYRQTGDERGLAGVESNLGTVLDQLFRHQEAIVHHGRAAERFAVFDDRLGTVKALHNLAVSHAYFGLAHPALEYQHRAEALLNEVEGAQILALRSAGNLAARYADLEEYTRAWAELERALGLVPEGWEWARAHYRTEKVKLLLLLGALEEAQAELGAVLELRAQGLGLPDDIFKVALTLQAQIKAWRGESPHPELSQAQPLSDAHRPYTKIRFTLVKATLLSPQEALPLAQEVLEFALEHQLPAVELAARTRMAQVLLRLKKQRRALGHTEAAMSLLRTYDPTDFYRGEILLTHCLALEAARQPGRLGHLEATLKWLLETAEGKVPPLYQKSFLWRNPTNRTILEMASQQGIA